MTIFRHRIFRLALVALLLFAQHVAIAHQTSHVFDDVARQALLSQARNEGAGEAHKVFHSDLCDFHGAFEGLLSAVGSTPPALRIAGNAIEQHAAVCAAVFPTEAVIPASRGPPALPLFS